MAKRRSSNINKGKRTVLGLIGCTHNSVKGIDTSINASALVSKDFHLEILGGGDHAWAKNITDKLSVLERMRFHGVVQGGALVLKWLDETDVYIKPSRAEGLPKATLNL